MTAFRAPRAAPKRCSASDRDVGVVVDEHRQPESLRHQVPDRHVGEVQVDGDDRHAALAVDRARDARARPPRRRGAPRAPSAARARASRAARPGAGRGWAPSSGGRSGARSPRPRPASSSRPGRRRWPRPCSTESRLAPQVGTTSRAGGIWTMRQYYPLMPADGRASRRAAGPPRAPRLQGLPVAPRAAEPPAVAGPLQAPRPRERQGRKGRPSAPPRPRPRERRRRGRPGAAS